MRFCLKEWLAADADPRAPTDASLADGVSCDEAGCVTPLAGGGLVALALKPEALSRRLRTRGAGGDGAAGIAGLCLRRDVRRSSARAGRNRAAAQGNWF